MRDPTSNRHQYEEKREKMADEYSVDRMVKKSELPKIFPGVPSDSTAERVHAEIVDSRNNEVSYFI